MLNTMRQKGFIKVTIWITVVGFVTLMVFGWAANIEDWLSQKFGPQFGRVNDYKITYEKFNSVLGELYNHEKARSENAEPDRKRLINQAWDALVGQVIISQQIKKRNIKVSDSELAYYNRILPPQIVQDLEVFQTEGEFDPAKYSDWLNIPANYEANRQFILGVEAMVRDRLLIQKLRNRVGGAVKVTDPEVRKAYIDDNEKVKVKYVFAAIGSFPDSLVSVSEEEVKTYYQENQDEFKEEAQTQCQYVAFDKKPSHSDSLSTEKRIRDLFNDAKSGADFAELAEENSEDPGSAQKGGDLGFFARGWMDKTFVDAAFALDEGEISEPVKSFRGWHIIKLEEKKMENGQEKVRARHILLKVEASRSTIEELADKADMLIEKDQQIGFDAAAKAEGLEIKDTGFFKKGPFIPGIGISQSLVNQAFAADIGEILRLYEDDRGFFIISVSDRKKEGISPLSQAREKIRWDLTRDKKRDLAEEKLQPIASAISQGASMEDAAESASLPVKETDEFAPTDFIPDIGGRNEFIAAAFKLQEGQVSPVVSSDRGAYLMQLVMKEPIDEEEFQKEKDSLKERLLQEKSIQVFNSWYAHHRGNAEIIDNRHLYYNF